MEKQICSFNILHAVPYLTSPTSYLERSSAVGHRLSAARLQIFFGMERRLGGQVSYLGVRVKGLQ